MQVPHYFIMNACAHYSSVIVRVLWIKWALKSSHAHCSCSDFVTTHTQDLMLVNKILNHMVNCDMIKKTLGFYTMLV